MAKTRVAVFSLLCMAGMANADEAGTQWRLATGASAMDDSPTVSLSVSASNSVATKFGNSITPVLTVRCQENKTSIYVDFSQYITTGDVDGEHQVRYRIDQKKPVEAYWAMSTNFEAVGVWRGAVGLVQEVGRAERFILETVPYGSSPVTVQFDVSGLAKRLPPLAKACGWTVEPAVAQKLPPQPGERSRTENRSPPQPAPVLSPAEISASFANAITPCWNIDPTLLPNMGGQVIELTVTVSAQGRTERAEVVDKARMARDRVFRTFAESAQRATMNPRCSTLPPGIPRGQTIAVSLDPRALF